MSSQVTIMKSNKKNSIFGQRPKSKIIILRHSLNPFATNAIYFQDENTQYTLKTDSPESLFR